MSRTPRSVWDAVNEHRRASTTQDSSGCGLTSDDSSRGAGEASPGDAPAPAATLGRYIGMQIAAVHGHNADTIVLELNPLGRMSRRWVCITGTGLTVTDVSDPPAPTYRNRRGITEQQHIDIGDDMFEKEREDRP